MATQGRSFWILDDLTFLHQLQNEITQQSFTVMKPRISYRTDGYRNDNVRNEGMNPPNGGWRSIIGLKTWKDSSVISFEIFDAKNKFLRKYGNKVDDKDNKISAESGMKSVCMEYAC